VERTLAALESRVTLACPGPCPPPPRPPPPTFTCTSRCAVRCPIGPLVLVGASRHFLRSRQDSFLKSIYFQSTCHKRPRHFLPLFRASMAKTGHRGGVAGRRRQKSPVSASRSCPSSQTQSSSFARFMLLIAPSFPSTQQLASLHVGWHHMRSIR